MNPIDPDPVGIWLPLTETEAEFWHRKRMESLRLVAERTAELDAEKRENAKLRWCLERAVAHDFDRKQYAGYADDHALMIDDLMSRYDEMLEDEEIIEEDRGA